MSNPSTLTLDVIRDRYLPEIEALMRQVTLQSLPPDSALAEIIAFHLGTGGKRLRALIPVLLAVRVQHPVSDVLHFAAACEMLHNATLVHDDLQDGDETRRHKPTVWKQYSPASAINTGDAMLYLTLLLPFLSKTSRSMILCQTILKYTLQVIDGQEKEFLLQKEKMPSWQSYETMVEGKTSGLFCLPLVGAAQLLQLPSSQIEALHQAGKHLGILFQIQDDVLDIYGSKGRLESYSDLREGKLSCLVVYALESLRTKNQVDDATWFRDMLRQPREQVTQSDIERALDLFEQTDAKNAMLHKIKAQQDLAVSSVAGADPEIADLIYELSLLFCQPIENI